MLENRGCRGRIVDRIGLNMSGRVERGKSDKMDSLICAGYYTKEEDYCIYFGMLKLEEALSGLGLVRCSVIIHACYAEE